MYKRPIHWRRQKGKVAPSPLSFWAVFPVRANPFGKIFRGYTLPTPPNFCRLVVPLMKQAKKMHCLTCEYFFFRFKHQLTRLALRVAYLCNVPNTNRSNVLILNPIVDCTSQAKPRRESNPKPAQRFPFNAAVYVTDLLNSHCNLAKNGVYKSTLVVRKKQGSAAGAR